MKNLKMRPILFKSFFILIFPLIIAGCEKQEPIKIGFIGPLTGKFSDIGIGGRDGAILAIEEENKKGGINGRKIVLIVKDDMQDQNIAIKKDKELIEEGVVAIIGHMTSQMSVSVMPFINKKKIVLISPTTSSNSLTGIDDYFLRVIPPNIYECKRLAHYAYEKMGIRKISVIYDVVNLEYTGGYFDTFKGYFESLGGTIICVRPFKSRDHVRYREIINDIIDYQPDGVLIIANSVDSAMLCQHLRLAGSKAKVILAGWAMTEDFIRHGGDAIEGVIFCHPFFIMSKSPKAQDFMKRFRKRFGYSPNFAAAKGYEAAKIIIKALKKNLDPSKIKDTIINIKRFEGLDGDFIIDRFGDPKRKLYLITVKNGEFIRVE